MANIFGKNIKIEIFGESHGKGVGCVIDGIPAGVKVDTDYINQFMARRKSDGVLGTKRVEDDIPEIISGLYNGYTTGSPICVLINNANKNSSSYDYKVVEPRPSHADYTAHIKYSGYADMRGGGHFSGRLTAPIVFAGALCSSVLDSMGITIGSHIAQIGSIQDDFINKVKIDKNTLKNLKNSKIPCLNNDKKELMESEIIKARDAGDSVGGIIECAVVGIEAGIGSPFFYSVESALSQIIMSIPGVKGIDFGAGFDYANMSGSEANDPFYYDNDELNTDKDETSTDYNKKQVKISNNNNGGILGGITTGMPIVFKCVIKPTPSIFIEQDTVNLESHSNVKLSIKGRHDPCIVLRAVPVVEAATAIALLDLINDNRR